MFFTFEKPLYVMYVSKRLAYGAARIFVIFLTLPAFAVDGPPEELVPDSQFARLGYVAFGRAVAARGDVVLAASRADGDELLWNYNGGNWIDAFHRQDTGWVDEAGLVAMGGDSSNDTPTDTDDFGAAVALTPTGRTALIGAPNHDGHGRDSGAVFMFRSLNGSWYPSGQLVFDGEPHQHFGAAIATDGDPAWAVVGAPGDEYDDEDTAGAVYVYEPCYSYGYSFCLPDVLPAPTNSGVGFGSSVAIAGKWLAVSVPWGGNPNPAQEGAVFIYQFKNMYERWQLAQILFPEPGSSVRVFGGKVAFGGPQSSYLAVQVPADYIGDRRVVSIHLYQLQEDQWTYSQRLVPPPNPDFPPTWFGSIDFSESVLAASEPDRKVSPETNGVVRSFRFDGHQWFLASSHRAPESYQDIYRFGEAVAVSGDVVIAGAPGDIYFPVPTTRGNVFSMIVPTLGDVDSDGDIDLSDTAMLVDRLDGPGTVHCGFDAANTDYDADNDGDLFDVAVFQRAIAR
jgi:hypothetical protein